MSGLTLTRRGRFVVELALIAGIAAVLLAAAWVQGLGGPS